MLLLCNFDARIDRVRSHIYSRYICHPFLNSRHFLGSLGTDHFRIISHCLARHQTCITAGARRSGDAYARRWHKPTRNAETFPRRTNLFLDAPVHVVLGGGGQVWTAQGSTSRLTIDSNIGFAFGNGGPRALVWGSLVVFAGVLCQVASMAEIASARPTSGARYLWTHQLTPPKHRHFLAWMQGWITWFSWIALLAGVANIGAVITQSVVADHHPNYVPQGWHLTLIMCALLTVQGWVNMHMSSIIPWLELLAGFLHVVLWIVWVVVLVSLAPRHTVEFVFSGTSARSGWANEYVSFNLGMLTATWGFVGMLRAILAGGRLLTSQFRLRRGSTPVRGRAPRSPRGSESHVLEHGGECRPGWGDDPRVALFRGEYG